MKNFKLSKILNNGGLFLLLVVGAIYFLFKSYSPGQIVSAIMQVNLNYVFLGILCMCAFVGCEALNTRRCLKMFGYNIGYFTCIKYAIIGFFFCSITPSSTGGQPMQIYFMHKDKIMLCHGSLALLIELACYQFVSVSLAILGFIYQYELLTNINVAMKALILFGLTLNTIIGILIGVAIFSNKLIYKLVDIAIKILNIIGYKDTNNFEKLINSQVEEYKLGAKYFTTHKKQVFAIFSTTIIQIVSLHSISFWVYKAFGLSEYSIFFVIAIQAVLYITVSALPLPGTVGVSEGSFLILFQLLYPVSTLSSAMVLSRGISFYLFVALTGIFVTIFSLSQNFANPTLN